MPGFGPSLLIIANPPPPCASPRGRGGIVDLVARPNVRNRADQPDVVEQRIAQIGEYLQRFGSFMGEAAVSYPNDFIVAVATVWVAIFTCVLAIATIRSWNSHRPCAGAKKRALTRKMFVANQRPWIKVTVKPVEAFQSDGSSAHLWLSIRSRIRVIPARKPGGAGQGELQSGSEAAISLSKDATSIPEWEAIAQAHHNRMR